MLKNICLIFFISFPLYFSPSICQNIVEPLTLEIFDNPSIITKIVSTGPDLAGAKKYVYLTGAAYCFNLSSWDCPPCLKAKENGQEFRGTVTDGESNYLALFTANNENKEIVVTFRGMFNFPGILAYANFTKVDINDDSAVQVHSGLLSATESLYPQVVGTLQQLLETNEGYSVVFNGHGIGAAQASITLYKIQNRFGLNSSFPEGVIYSFFGYSEPRVGNRAWADYWNSQQKIPMTRIVSKADIFPHAYFGIQGYIHHGTELWITPINGEKPCSKNLYEDPSCSNSMSLLYNFKDHFFYWDVDYLTCLVEKPGDFLEQFI